MIMISDEYSRQHVDFCLLIPCYNDFPGLVRSLKTVSYYTDRFKVVVVDDGSAVPVTMDAIQANAAINYAVVILRNDRNEGITGALNKGLNWIEENVAAQYIARLDCGDLCDPHRFYKQMDYMAAHPETALLGSWCVFKNQSSSFQYLYKAPVDDLRIKRAMHIRNVFIHPTVVFRASLLPKVGHYPTAFPYAEDYAFFWELMKLGRSHILNESLVTCEVDNKGISLTNRHQQLRARARIIAEYGTNHLLKSIGIFRTKVLHIVPKQLALRLKKFVSL